MTTEETCPLPYPKRFEAAVDFVTNPHPKAKSIPDDLRLLLFALHKQATVGACNEPKPWSWNVVETAKWESWHRLNNMSKVDAMRHYVNQLEKNQPDWWTILSGESSQKPIDASTTAQLEEETSSREKTKSLYKKLEDATAAGSWSTPYLSNASKPIARYEQGMVLVDKEMYLIGGNCGGKYLNDIWCFDFISFAWTRLDVDHSEDNLLPPLAGHVLVHWQDSILVVGGHVKSKDVTEKTKIRSLDLKSLSWTEVETTGEIPVSRGGHTATLLGHYLYVFGGEDAARRPLGDLHLLDMNTLQWTNLTIPKSTIATPRSAHVAVPYMDRYIVFFGGGSVAACFDDLIVFDTQKKKWHRVKVVGRRPSLRAGHSAAVLQNRWYIVGGGNNSAGCTDMAYLDLSQMNVWPPSMQADEDEEGVTYQESPDLDDVDYEISWTVIGTIPERSYLASEGMSLVSMEDSGILIAFGGYNGKYSNSVSLFRPKEDPPAVRQLSFGSEVSGREIEKDNGQEGADAPKESKQVEALQAKLEAVNKNAAAAKEATVNELSIMRKQLTSANSLLHEKDTILEQTRQQLTEEEGKTLRLEAEIAELNNKLKKMEDLEKELEIYRRQKQQMSAGKTGGIWGWVAGEN